MLIKFIFIVCIAKNDEKKTRIARPTQWQQICKEQDERKKTRSRSRTQIENLTSSMHKQSEEATTTT